MTEREDPDSAQPRKRIAVAVSSTETHLRNENNSDFGYNLDAARPYANQSRGSVSSHNSLSQYTAEIPAGGDMLASYRQGQNPYPYNSKNYYSAMSGWSGTYPEEVVDYGLNYPSYPMLSQDTSPMVQGYGRYGSSGKSGYVDPESSSYSYGSLVHRPAAVSSDTQGFSLSGMAASLPTPPDRMVPSDRLLSHVNRTLTGSSNYRGDGLPAHYSGSKTSPASTISDAAYGSLHSSFEAPYSGTSTVPSSISHRSASHADSAAYQPSTSATDGIYSSGDQSLRSNEDSYIYSDSKLDGSRRDSHSSGGASTGSVLSNGHVYIPESHHAHAPSQGYVVSGASASQGSGVDGATASAGGRGHSASGRSHAHSDSHRRSAGSLRGG